MAISEFRIRGQRRQIAQHGWATCGLGRQPTPSRPPTSLQRGKPARQHRFHAPQCCLTLRSSGRPTAGHLGREASSAIIRFAAQVPCRRSPLSSNVRQHKRGRGMRGRKCGACAPRAEQPRSGFAARRLRQLHSASHAQHQGRSVPRNLKCSVHEPIEMPSQSVGLPQGGRSQVLRPWSAAAESSAWRKPPAVSTVTHRRAGHQQGCGAASQRDNITFTHRSAA